MSKIGKEVSPQFHNSPDVGGETTEPRGPCTIYQAGNPERIMPPGISVLGPDLWNLHRDGQRDQKRHGSWDPRVLPVNGEKC